MCFVTFFWLLFFLRTYVEQNIFFLFFLFRAGKFSSPTLPNKCQDFTLLVSSRGGRDGVIHPGGVNHGDMCLTPEHGQIHPGLLNIYHEIAERRPICHVARGSPELHGELGLYGRRVVHCVPQFLKDGVDAGVYRIPGGLLAPPPRGLRPLLVDVGLGVGSFHPRPPVRPGGGEYPRQAGGECLVPLALAFV